MKILYYNWVPLGDPRKRGGGVRIYQEGLIKTALAHGHEVTYFSAGMRLSLIRRGLKSRRLASQLDSRVKEFEVVNSPIRAPSHAQFGRTIQSDIESRYVEFLVDLINSHGPFDVLHLNNVEGLPFALFLERARLNVRAIVLTLHNYHPLCQQVNLWYNEKSACIDYAGGRRCVHCVPPPRHRIVAEATFQELVRPLGGEGSIQNTAALSVFKVVKAPISAGLRVVRMISRRIRKKKGLAEKVFLPRGEVFRRHRESAILSMNRGIDAVVAVSDRVRQIYCEAGVRPERVTTLYIANNFADGFSLGPIRERFKNRETAHGKPIHIAFLGYARRDKGFFFLLQALEALPRDEQARIELTIAAKGAASHIAEIERRLLYIGKWKVMDGYTHQQLPELLSGVDLGVVPVLWEDNLPQVAYEFVAHGVPILTSDRGGARELVDMQEFVFRSGDARSFGLKIRGLLGDRDLLRRFWDNEHMPMKTWTAHWAELSALYGRLICPESNDLDLKHHVSIQEVAA